MESAISSKFKGDILIIIGIILCLVPVYLIFSPALIPKSPPIFDVISAEEFLTQPKVNEERTELAKDILKRMFGYRLEKVQDWLIFPQDYLEARPTGGFPGTYIHIKTKNGNIENIKFEDIWKFDKPLQKEGKPQLNQNSWWSHFPHAAGYAINVYKENTGQKIDGVMAIDPTGIKYLLKAIGSIEVEDYNETVTSENILDKILSYSPYLDKKNKVVKHKDFMASIVESLQKKISDFDVLSKRNDVSKQFLRAMERKHILLYFKDKEQQKILEQNNWAGSLKTGQKTDFLAVRDYNGGINKVDAYIDRDIEYFVNVNGRDSAEAELRIKYSYKYNPDLYKKYGKLADDKHVEYKNMLRVYVPKNSTLIDYDGYDRYVEKEEEDGKTVFKGFLALNAGQKRTVVLRYKLPHTFKDEYRLIIQKQPGTPVLEKKPPKMRVELNVGGRSIEAYYPNYNSFNEKQIIFNSNLEYDRYIKLRFAK